MAPAATPAGGDRQNEFPAFRAGEIWRYVKMKANKIEQWAMENHLDDVLEQVDEFHGHDCPACKSEYFFNVLGIYTDRNQTKKFNQMWRSFNAIQAEELNSFNIALMKAVSYTHLTLPTNREV